MPLALQKIGAIHGRRPHRDAEESGVSDGEGSSPRRRTSGGPKWEIRIARISGSQASRLTGSEARRLIVSLPLSVIGCRLSVSSALNPRQPTTDNRQREPMRL